MAYKKTNEAWFGDSFNRDIMNCTAYVSGADVGSVKASTAIGYCDKGTATFTIADCATNENVLSSIAHDGITYALADKAARSDVETMQERLQELANQIEELKITRKESILRNQLKTLSYKREVE